MNCKAGVHVFLAISLATVLLVPIVNLLEPTTLARAQQLLTARDHTRLVRLLFHGDKLVSWVSSRVSFTGISTSSNHVVIGYDGWLHMGDRFASSISAARGSDADAREETASAINLSLLAWDKWLHGQGVQSLVFMLSPNKSSVYPQTLPKWVTSPLTDPLFPLSNGNHPVVLDLRDDLRHLVGESEYPLYYKTDSHWNQLGAAHAFVLLGERLLRQDPSLQWPLATPLRVEDTQARQGGDLARFLRIAHKLADTEILLSLDRPERFETTVTDFHTGELVAQGTFAVTDFPRRTVYAHTPNALNRRRVLWLKDSFGAGMSPFMSAAFDETVQLHITAGMKDRAQTLRQLVQQWRPQLVIFTVVERHALAEIFIASPPHEN